MLIEIKAPNSPYNAITDTGVTEVTITKAFIGPRFITPDGEELVVIMRDSGFEVLYSGVWYSFQNGGGCVRLGPRPYGGCVDA